MSRTYKDRPAKIHHKEDYLPEHQRTLKRKEEDWSWHWTSAAPSWWTNLFMNRPLRRKAKNFEVNAVKVTDKEELEDLDYPDTGHKPFKYYY